MEDEGRLRTDSDSSATDGSKSIFTDAAVAADYSVAAVGNGDGDRFTAGVENDDNFFPFLLGVIKTESYRAVWCIKEFQVLAYKFCRAESESRMVLSQRDEVAIVFEHLRIFLLMTPVKLIDTVGGLKAVVHTLLVRSSSSPLSMKGTPCDVNTAV